MKQAINTPVIITLEYHDASDDDCKRTNYVTVYMGKEYLLAGDALGGVYTDKEVIDNARKFFGNDVIINW